MSESPPSDTGAVVRADTPEHPSVVALLERFPEAVQGWRISAGDQYVVSLDPLRNVEVLRWLQGDPDHRYDLLSDVTAVDFGGGRPLTVVYQLWSIAFRRSLRVTCELPLSSLEIASVTGVWKSADWVEREVYDMFGIVFRDHPDLRRILMPQNYAEGHPLRKDFPLRGRFSRAEQTRRALSQDPDDYYVPSDIASAGAPQVMPGGPSEALTSGDGRGASG